MRIAITGATGFLGKYLVNYLSLQRHYIYVVSRPEEEAYKYFDNKITICESDYTLSSLLLIFKNIDVVIHLAAQTMDRNTDPLKVSSFYPVNVQITENVLLASHQNNVSRICQMSSNSIYSSSNKIPFREHDNPIPSTIYGVSKLYAEKLGEYYVAKTKMNVVSLRLARLFGYGERPGVVFMKYMNLSREKKPLTVWGEGKTSIEYLYVKDAVCAIDKAIQSDFPSGVYNVGPGKAYSVLEIAEAINSVCGNSGNIIFDHDKPEGNYNILMDSTKFNLLTGWTAKWGLLDAIEDINILSKE